MRFRDKVRHQRRHERLLLGLLLIVIVGMLASCGNTNQKGVMHSEVYTVSRGDTLWSIASKYIDRNTHGTRDIREFYCGIIENNWQVFEGRRHGEVHPGDKLTITWWTKE